MDPIQDTSGQDRVIARRGPKRSTKIMIGLAVVLIIAAVTVYPSVMEWSRTDASFDRSRLRFAQVTRGDLIRDLSVEGRIVASSYPTVFSPAQGLVKLRVKAGDPVRTGDVLAHVDSPELTSRLQQEASSLAGLEGELSRQIIATKTTNLTNKQDVDLKKLRLETAQRELKRSKLLLDAGLANQIEFDADQDAALIAEVEYKHAIENADLQKETLALEVQNVEKQVERQRLIWEEAQRRVGELTLVSPVSGVVGSVTVDPHDIVARNQEIMTVIDLSSLEISISIPENYADEIELGATTQVTYENQRYSGTVSSISPEVNNSVVEGRVVFSGAVPKGLKQNQRVSTRIILATVENTLTVRRGPFLESGGGRKVYVIDGNLALLREVETGATSLTEVQVVSGLNEGDTIIISDTSRFRNAQTIYLRN